MWKINKSANWKSRDKNWRFMSEKQHKDLNNNDNCDCYGFTLTAPRRCKAKSCLFEKDGTSTSD